MLTLLAAIALSYKVPATPLEYTMKVDFAGYIPVLGGQENADCNVAMGFTVNSTSQDAEGNPRAVFDLTDVEIKFGGAPLPFDLDSVRPYFPKNTISHTPTGKILKTDAPDIQLPVRLPGLDVKRIPDITYMPIEFPAEGVEVGKAFEFKKKFGDSEVSYKVTAVKQEGATLFLDLTMSQTYETMEDEAKNVTIKAEDAAARVKTTVEGKGTIQFDVERGVVVSSKVVADASSTVSSLKGEDLGKRNLKTTVQVDLRAKS